MLSGELYAEEGGTMLPMKLPPMKHYLIGLVCHCLPKCLLLVRLLHINVCIRKKISRTPTFQCEHLKQVLE